MAQDQVKLTKLVREMTSSHNSPYMMSAYDVPKARWVFKLAPNLTGRTQQAYTALSIDDAGEYDQVKQAILARYDINAET